MNYLTRASAWAVSWGAMALAASSPVFAEMAIDALPTGEAWIYQQPELTAPGEDALNSVSPHWIVQCPQPRRGCFGRTGPIVLTVDETGAVRLFLDPHPKGQIALILEDYAYDLEDFLGNPLSPTWQDRLSDPEALLVAETEDAIAIERPLRGFELTLQQLRSLHKPWAETDARAAPIEEATPLDALAEAAETAQAGNPRLVPDTKPQIEFAIRAQTEVFPANE